MKKANPTGRTLARRPIWRARFSARRQPVVESARTHCVYVGYPGECPKGVLSTFEITLRCFMVSGTRLEKKNISNCNYDHIERLSRNSWTMFVLGRRRLVGETLGQACNDRLFILRWSFSRSPCPSFPLVGKEISRDIILYFAWEKRK